MIRQLTTALAFSAAALATTAVGQTFIDGFSYTDGALVGQGAWAQIGGSATNPVQVSGGAISLANTGQDIGVDTGITFSSGSIYAGFDLTLSAAQTGDYFFAFNTGQTATNYSGRFYARAADSGFQLGLQMGVTGATPSYQTDVLSFGTTYRIVVRYDISADGAQTPGNDTGIFYVNPTSATEGANTAAVSLVGWAGTTQDNGSFNAIALRQGGSSSAATISSFDNLVVSSNFAAAAAVPEPSTYAAIFGGLALAGAVIRRRFMRRG